MVGSGLGTDKVDGAFQPEEPLDEKVGAHRPRDKDKGVKSVERRGFAVEDERAGADEIGDGAVVGFDAQAQ